MDVVAAIVPVLVLILIGMACKKVRLASPQGMAEMKAIISNIMLPVTLFNALGSANYGKETIQVVAVFFFVEVAAMLAGWLLQRFVRGENSRLLPILTTTAEGGMLGYPLYIILSGEANLVNMATIDIAVTIFGFSIWSSVIRQIESGEKMSAKRMGDMALHNPCLWSVGLGIIAGVSGFMGVLLNSPVGIVYQQTVSLVTAPLSAMILIALGYDLVFERDMISQVLSSVLSRLGIQMVLLLITWQLIGRNASYDMQTALLLYFFLPVAFISQVYVSRESSKAFVATFASLYSLISIAAFAVLAIVR